jgi:uncharacterized protein YqjF (DUF2071 family)
MMEFLKNHPFAVETFFDTSLVLTYAVPVEELVGKIPECLSLDVFDERWAFVAVAMVKTKALRPKGFPAFMGSDFILTGYRVFVRYSTTAGKRLRGLYILKSETDSKRMSVLGNIFTHYNYGTCPMRFERDAQKISVISETSGLEVLVSLENTEAALPAGSPFANWKEARRYAGPLPFTFTYDALRKEVLIIEGVRENWTPQPVEVVRAHVGFIEELGIQQAVLANAFVIHDIPYYWKKGRIEQWTATNESLSRA